MTNTHEAYYDREADAIYVTMPGMEDARLARTEAWGGAQLGDTHITFDYDAAGALIGIEILGVSQLPPPPPAEEQP